MSDPFDDLWGALEESQDTSAADNTRIQGLLDKLVRARHTYYNNGSMPEGMDSLDISDAEYDAYEDELRDEVAKAERDGKTPDWLKDAQSFLANVGAPSKPTGKQHWVKVKHEAPMGSLNKSQLQEEGADPYTEFRAWYKGCVSAVRQGTGVRPLNLVVSDKCDGISLSLKYDEGELVRGVTRGDGEEGEDITRNVVKMKGVRQKIPGFSGYLRAEIVLRKSDWKKHFPGYSNPRNAASGIAKRLDGEGSEHLTVLHYQVIRVGGSPVKSKLNEFKVLQKLGCPTPRFAEVDTVEKAIALYDAYVAKGREELDYDIDGLVFEFDDLEVMSQLGEKNHRPAGATAFKFPHDKKISSLEDKLWQVGRTGRVTPVAIFEQVRLAGANVTNASLHNISNIRRLLQEGNAGRDHFCVGDKVLVSRRNDVIPYVEKFISAGPGKKPLLPPTECPECGHTLVMDGEYLVCKNSAACPAQISGLISTWVTKIGLKGWGDTVIQALTSQDLVAEPADLYNLDPNELSEVEMSGRKIGSTAHTIMKELKGKGTLLPLHVFVGSLGIPLCARSVCKMIVDAGYDTLEKMRAATVTEISAIPKLGLTKAEAFVTGMLVKADVIDNLLAAGVEIKPPADGPLKGKTVCMTGFRDADMTSTIEDQGGTVKSSVSRTLDYLVLKDPKSTSGKAKKARDYNEKATNGHVIGIVGIDEMWEILNG